MTAVVVIALLALASLVYVTVPLRRDAVGIGPDPTEDAAARKRRALEAILDLEAELDAGTLSTSDFAELRTEYEAEAVDAMRKLGLLEKCPSCGAPRSPGERCAACGA